MQFQPTEDQSVSRNSEAIRNRKAGVELFGARKRSHVRSRADQGDGRAGLDRGRSARRVWRTGAKFCHVGTDRRRDRLCRFQRQLCAASRLSYGRHGCQARLQGDRVGMGAQGGVGRGRDWSGPDRTAWRIGRGEPDFESREIRQRMAAEWRKDIHELCKPSRCRSGFARTGDPDGGARGVSAFLST